MKACKQKSKLSENNLNKYNSLNFWGKQLPTKVTWNLRLDSHVPKPKFIKLNDIFMSRDISLDLRLRAINLHVYSIIL